MSLVLRRQHQMRAKLAWRFVSREAGWVGRDLEQDPARLAEVDRVEILPVDHGRHVETGGFDPLAPFPLCGVVLGAESDVVDSARALAADRARVGTHEIHDRSPAAGGRAEAQALHAAMSLVSCGLVAENIAQHAGG